MGLFSKLRSDERRKSLPLVPKPYMGHAKTYTSESSAADASEFLLTASASSHSLVETHKRHSESQFAPKMADQSYSYSPQYKLVLMPLPADPNDFYSRRPNAPHLLSNRKKHPDDGNLNAYKSSNAETPGQNYSIQNSTYADQKYRQGENEQQYARHAGYNNTGVYIQSKRPILGQNGTYCQSLAQDKQYQFPNQSQYHNHCPVINQRHSYGPQAFPSVPEDTSAEFSEEDSTSEPDSESENDSDSESSSQKHPYYHQWKQYYAAMASYQALVHQKRTESNPRHSMYSGIPVTKWRSTSPGSTSDYLSFYQHSSQRSFDNELVRNSRRSTLKLNRSSSVPPLDHRKGSHTPRSRAISVNVTIPPENHIPRSTSSSGLREDYSGARPSRLGSASVKLISHGLLAVSVTDQDETGEISDYEAFLFDDSDADSSTQDIPEPQSTADNNTGNTNLEDTQQAIKVPKPQSQISKDVGKTNFETTQQINAVLESSLRDILAEAGPPSKDFMLEASPEGLNRHGSSASTNSYNSLQSESNFSVGRTPQRLVTPTSSTRSARRRAKNAHTFVPPMQGPPPPILSSAPPLAGPDFNAPLQNLLNPRIQTMTNMHLSDSIYIHQMQQQIQHLQQMQQMMPMYKASNPSAYNGLSASQAWSSDSTINARIEEFIELRRVIASGKKSVEYRLKWMRMLVVAVQYKLYAYINIKGDSIPQDQISQNKQFFVNSSVTHLKKLLKELDGPKLPTNYIVFAETCYIYGCLLKHEYVERYDHDFGIARDNDQAETYLLKCLELNPAFFKAHYALADIYEKKGTEELFDKALEHYKESARLGYYRGIYRVALIYLMVPKVRSISYFKYLRNLSEIDMQSKDIQLSGSDRDELEEVVGLGLYHLGRIYEGVYPGDLTADHDFVKESLVLAPVNYAKSLTYYNRAAKHHCLLAQVKLGHVYENGDLNRKYNASKSIQWFIKASTSPLKFKRHPEAMIGISRWFMKGSSGESKHIPYPDPQRAVEWCERACKEFHYPEAYYNMGLFAQQGLTAGNPEDWFAEAARLGYQPEKYQEPVEVPPSAKQVPAIILDSHE